MKTFIELFPIHFRLGGRDEVVEGVSAVRQQWRSDVAWQCPAGGAAHSDWFCPRTLQNTLTLQQWGAVLAIMGPGGDNGCNVVLLQAKL